MPALKTHVTGRHQGRETVISNLKEVAKALERDTLYIMKYFSIELQSRYLCDEKTSHYQIHGFYEAEELATVLDRFIDQYVLCGSPECKLPETNLEITGSKLRMTCRACGKTTLISSDHKLTNFIMKNPRANVTIKEKNEDDDLANIGLEQLTWSVDTSKEAVERRRQEAIGQNRPKVVSTNEEDTTTGAPPDLQQQLTALKEFVSTKPEVNTFIGKVQKLQRQYNWNEQQVITNLFMTLFDNNIIYQIHPFARFLEPFVCDEKDQRVVLNCLERLCNIDNSVIDNTCDILYGFYKYDVIEEDTYPKWHKAMNKKLDPKISRKIRITAKPFIQWLIDAEEEEDLLRI